MNKRFIEIIIIILSASILELKASDIMMYVWAPNGLHIRSEPNTHSKILGVLYYGDSLHVIEKTDFTFTNLFMQSREGEKHPIHLTSNWVKIEHLEKEGFIIDGYLLQLPWPRRNESLNPYLDRMAKIHEIQKLDTTYRLRFGNVVFDSEQIVFPDDKRISWFKEKVILPDDGIETEADYAIEDLKYFKGFSKQEIVVFLNIFYGLESEKQSNYDNEGMYVRRNWA